MRSFSEWYLNHNVSTFIPPLISSNKSSIKFRWKWSFDVFIIPLTHLVVIELLV